MNQLLELLDRDKVALTTIEPLLERAGMELKGAARENDLYRYRLCPIGEKKVISHFKTKGEIISYLTELLNSTEVCG